VWRPSAARLLPHALAATDHATALRVGRDGTVMLLEDAATYLSAQAEDLQAKLLYQRILSILELEPAPDHRRMARIHGRLGAVLRHLEDFEGARRHIERAAALDEATHGDEPRGQHLHNLALVLRDQGNLDGARALLERALTDSEAGHDIGETASQLASLADVLADQGELDQAQAMLEQVVTVGRDLLAPITQTMPRTSSAWPVSFASRVTWPAGGPSLSGPWPLPRPG
jgi:tetratricopeptide (TPR) repeat protein